MKSTARTVAAKSANHGRTAHPTCKRESPAPCKALADAGNQAVQAAFRDRCIQARLVVGANDDPLEREADSIADAVVQGRQPCSCGGDCPDCQKQKERLRRKPRGGDPASGRSAATNILSRLGLGRPLEPAAQRLLSSRLGQDFSRTRIHTGKLAHQSASAINARAFTYGDNIVFARGEYRPNTASGLHLLAHEVAHTIQQDAGRVVRRRIPEELAGDRPYYDPPRGSEHSPSAATPSTMDAIKRINRHSWVGPLDEYELERLWDSYGDSLPSVAESNWAEWHLSLHGGAELYDIPTVQSEKERFRAAIARVARGYLNENQDLAQREKQAVGAGTGAAPTPEQSAALEQRRQAADRIRSARRAQAGLRMTKVGYDRLPGRFALVDSECHPIANEWGNRGLVVKPFNPHMRPDLPPRGDECFEMPTWEATKAMWDRLAAVIEGEIARYPSLYALARDLREESIAISQGGESGADAARSRIGAALDDLLRNIERSRPRLETNFAFELKPIHETLLRSPPWNGTFKSAVGRKAVEGYEDRQFWISLGLGTLAAALFLVASLATGGMAAFFLGAGVGIGAGMAAHSWQHYQAMQQAFRTNLSDRTALVSSGQVSAALTTALLDTVFVFLDVFSAARAIRAGAGAARLTERALPRTVQAAERAEAQAAERALGEVAQQDLSQVASRLRAGAAREVRDEALRRQGYILEIEVEIAGRRHVYRQLRDGTWCRFGSRICGISFPGSEVNRLAANAREAIENPAAAALRESLESGAQGAPRLISATRIQEVVGRLAGRFPVLSMLSEGAAERIVRAAFAQASGGGLRRAGRWLSAARGQLMEEIANARVRGLLGSRAGRQALGLGHVTEELIFIEGHRIRTLGGAQLTDGVIAIRRGEQLEILSVLESKAGRFAAGGLTESWTGLRRASTSELAEALRQLAGGRVSTGLRRRFPSFDANLIDQIRRSLPIDRQHLMDALNGLAASDLRAIRAQLRGGEGQVARDVERLMEIASREGLNIDGRLVPVSLPRRPGFIGAVPRDVGTEEIAASLAAEGHRFRSLDLGEQGLTSRQLYQLARELVNALGQDLERAASAAWPTP